jgi:hypothetical protein
MTTLTRRLASREAPRFFAQASGEHGLVLRPSRQMVSLSPPVLCGCRRRGAWQSSRRQQFRSGRLIDPRAIAAAFPPCVGDPYKDGSGTQYLALTGQPILIYDADRAALSRALERALAWA